MGRLYSVSERNEIYYLRELLGQITTLSGHIGDNFTGFRNVYGVFNAAASPLLDGVAQNSTISIPIYSIIKRITVLGTPAGTAATIDIGPAVDDPNYISPSPAQIISNYDYSTISTPTTGERFITLTAQGGDITSGNIYIYIEYIYLPI